MSKLASLLGSALAGAAVVLGGAYILADQFVVDVPAPLRDRVIPAAVAQTDTENGTVTPTGNGDATPDAAEMAEAAPDADTPAEASDAENAVLAAADGPAEDAMPPVRAYALGRPATEEEVAAWDIDIRPDGAGLPVGSGNERDGEALYVERCAACHGDFGEAVDRWPVLAGGQGTLTRDRPVKTIGSYWPYLSTVFDYVHRAMPFGEAQSLTDDEVYAIVAHLLYLNDLVDQGFELSNENFAEIVLPNAPNFFLDDRAEGEMSAFRREVCMEDCKDGVEITGRAAVVDVTPEDTAARERLEEAAAKAAAERAQDAGTDGAEVAAADPPATEAGEEDAAASDEAQAAPVAEEGDTAGADAPDPALVAAGERAFRQCRACHLVGEDAKSRTGPHLNDLFGRVAGSLDDFRYSSAFQEKHDEGLVWTEDTLTPYLADPKGYIKGTKMSFRGFKDAEDIDAVLEYLRTFDE